MKKLIISFFVAGLLLINSFAVIGMVKRKAAGANQESINLQFSVPTITEKTIDKTTFVLLNNGGSANAQLYHAGQPILPMYEKTLSFPFGTNIINVEFTPQEVKTIMLQHKILPAPQPIIPDIQNSVTQYIIDQIIYNSDNLFPDNWVSYYPKGGLDSNGNHVTLLTIETYPARYNPATNTVNYVENGVLTITYQVSTQPITFGSGESDLVIIAPSQFSNELQKLVDEKNSHGISTALKMTDDIYSEFSGVDKPEQIKYFIKSAVNNGTKYIMLVGGMDSFITGTPRDDTNQGSKDWLVPVRYTNLRDSGDVYDPGYISDLYYADIYDSQGHFSSWDSNHDGIFAKWYGMSKDIIDLVPDVAVGRLTCRNKIELGIMINKIINYEKQPAASSWFNNMILVGGDSFNDTPTNIYEGEYTTTYTYEHYMSKFTPVKLYASYKDTDPQHTPTPTNIVREISAGAGNLLFDGHGNPMVWDTHWPDIFNWVGGINIYKFMKLSNGEKLPVCVVGGCHNSMFNVTLLSTMADDQQNTHHTWCYGSPCPESWSEWLTRKNGGGSIATLGNTGLGYGTVGENGDLDGDGVNDPDCVEALGGYLERMFYKSYDESSTKILGDIWSGTITKYLTTFPGMADQVDCKTVEEWPLIGDPTLKIGGYPASESLMANIVGAETGVVADPGYSVPTYR